MTTETFKGKRAMGCWVVPSIAADLWGMPLEAVMEGIRNGSIPSKTDHGFLVVHSSRNAAVLQADPMVASSAAHPSTYAILSEAEEAALLDDAPSLDSVRDPELAPADDDSATYPLADWHEVRENVSRTRKGPHAFAA